MKGYGLYIGDTEMQDALSGTWKLIPEKSNFDPNHRPLAATMVFV